MRRIGMGQRRQGPRPAQAAESAAEADDWAAHGAHVQAWLPAWDGGCPDDGRPRAAWRAAQAYRRTGTPENRERLRAAQAACEVAAAMPVQAYWSRRVHMQGAEVAFQVAKAVEYLCGRLLGTSTVARVEWHLRRAARAQERDQRAAEGWAKCAGPTGEGARRSE